MGKLFWTGILLSLLVISCGTRSEKSTMQAEASAAVSTASGDSTGTFTIEPDGQKRITQCNLRLQVDSMTAARSYLSILLKKYKAYIANENESRYSGKHESNMVIRVEGKYLDAFITDLCSKATFIDNKDLSTEDVGMEYIDIEARLNAKLESEKRYLALLQRAGKISEMLAIEHQLGIVRAEIESMQGRLKYFDKSIAYATLNVNLYEVVAIHESPGLTFFSRAVHAFSGGIILIQEGLLLIVTIWPLLLIAGPLLFILRNRKQPKPVPLTEVNRH